MPLTQGPRARRFLFGDVVDVLQGLNVLAADRKSAKTWRHLRRAIPLHFSMETSALLIRTRVEVTRKAQVCLYIPGACSEIDSCTKLWPRQLAKTMAITSGISWYPAGGLAGTKFT